MLSSSQTGRQDFLESSTAFLSLLFSLYFLSGIPRIHSLLLVMLMSVVVPHQSILFLFVREKGTQLVINKHNAFVEGNCNSSLKCFSLFVVALIHALYFS